MPGLTVPGLALPSRPDWSAHPILRALGELVGAYDPVVPTPPMITAYPVADEMGLAARKLATQRSTEKLTTTLQGLVTQGAMAPDEMAQTLGVAQRYPRVMAHVTEWSRDAAGHNGAIYSDPANPALSQIGLSAQSDHPARTALHELTHAAQAVWNKGEFAPRYNLLDDVYGYLQNPMEASARAAAARRIPARSGTAALDALRSFIETP